MSDIVTVHMVRHGPVSNLRQIWYGRDVDYDLTSPSAVEHFNRLAQVLPSDPRNTIWFSSDYPRAVALAQAVAQSVQGPVPDILLNHGLIEQQYGIMEGMEGAKAKAHPELKAYFKDMWNAPPPGGESMKMLQQRIGAELEETIAFIPPHIRHVVNFAHGAVNVAALAYVTQQKASVLLKSRRLENVPSFSYMSRLALQYDRGTQKWLGAVEYETGLPKEMAPH